MGKSGREKQGGRKPATYLTAVQIRFVEGLLGHLEQLGNTLVENDELCHSTCKRIHG